VRKRKRTRRTFTIETPGEMPGRRARSRVIGEHYRTNEFIRVRVIRGIAIREIFSAYGEIKHKKNGASRKGAENAVVFVFFVSVSLFKSESNSRQSGKRR